MAGPLLIKALSRDHRSRCRRTVVVAVVVEIADVAVKEK
jgi:hypothetical protein